MERFEFEYEATDRSRWPSRWGTVVVLADSYREAFDVAHAMVYGRRDVEMVTSLQLVL